MRTYIMVRHLMVHDLMVRHLMMCTHIRSVFSDAHLYIMVHHFMELELHGAELQPARRPREPAAHSHGPGARADAPLVRRGTGIVPWPRRRAPGFCRTVRHLMMCTHMKSVFNDAHLYNGAPFNGVRFNGAPFNGVHPY